MISYRQADLKVFEEGSNDEMRLRECIAFFELFLLNIGMKQVSVEDGVPLTYCDLIFFVTGSDFDVALFLFKYKLTQDYCTKRKKYEMALRRRGSTLLYLPLL